MRYEALRGYLQLTGHDGGVRWPREAHLALTRGIAAERCGEMHARVGAPAGRLWWYAPSATTIQLAAEGDFALGRGVICLPREHLAALLATRPWAPAAHEQRTPLATQLARTRGIVDRMNALTPIGNLPYQVIDADRVRYATVDPALIAADADAGLLDGCEVWDLRTDERVAVSVFLARHA